MARRLVCVYKSFLNVIFVLQKVELYKGFLDFLKTEIRVQKSLLYKAQTLVRITLLTNGEAIGLRIQTFSERDFRFSQSGVIPKMKNLFENRK